MVIFCVRVGSVVAFCVFLSAHVLPPGTRFLLLYQITPEFSSLKQYAFIISQFLQVWNMGVASLEHPALGPSQGCNQNVGHGTDGEASTSKFIQWPLAGCSSLWAIALKVSVPCWLLARGNSVPCHRSLSTGQLTIWVLASPEWAGRRRNHRFCQKNVESDFPAALLYSLEVSY